VHGETRHFAARIAEQGVLILNTVWNMFETGVHQLDW
jgi:hypothetical protein